MVADGSFSSEELHDVHILLVGVVRCLLLALLAEEDGHNVDASRVVVLGGE